MADRMRRTYTQHSLRIRPSLTPGEQRSLWDACLGHWPIERLVLALLLEMGLRPHEVCAVTFDDLQPGALSVRGKDGDTRRVPLGDQTTSALDRYLESAWIRDRRRQDSHATLVSLDEAGLAELIRGLATRAELGRPLNLHDLRRAAISRARATLGKGDDA